MRDPRERLQDMLEAIERIEKYASRGRKAFDKEELIQVFLLHFLQILGEAAYKVPAAFRKRNPDIPWDSIQGMRHILVHDYFQVDLDVVWGVVNKDLPGLKMKIQEILDSPTSERSTEPGVQEPRAAYGAGKKRAKKRK